MASGRRVSGPRPVAAPAAGAAASRHDAPATLAGSPLDTSSILTPMLEGLLKTVFGSKHDRELKRVRPIVAEINRFHATLVDLPDAALPVKTAEFKARVAAATQDLTDPAERRLAEQEALDALLPEAFAVVKEACRRLCGRSWDVVGLPLGWEMVPYDVQLIGAVMLHEGRIAEMATGEGKTLVATMPLYLNALTGRGAHLVTVNDYLARRDSEWMGEIFKTLGLTVGCIQQELDPPTRRQQYLCDITYGTNNEFGFDYLRDNMAVRPEHQVQRGFVYAIVDEVDSVLIDEARTPLIISGPVEHSDQAFDELKPLVERLVNAQRAGCRRRCPRPRSCSRTRRRSTRRGSSCSRCSGPRRVTSAS